MFREGSDDEDAPGDPLDQDAEIDRFARIRCPKCKWQPTKHDRWQCSCWHVWNTFDTRGLCPACGYQWHDTMCLKCHQWSKHLEWYEG